MSETSGRTPRDPGLQPERTALAWQRTAVVTLLLTVALGWRAASQGRPAELALAAVSAFWAAAAAAVVVPRSVHGFTPDAADRATHAVPWSRLVAVVGATVVLAVTGAVAALVSASANHP